MGCTFDVIGSIFGHEQLVMVNYARGFNQSETGKYFERIIISNVALMQLNQWFQTKGYLQRDSQHHMKP